VQSCPTRAEPPFAPPLFPPFLPHRCLRGGHAQTLAGFTLPGPKLAYRAHLHRIDLEDGDAIVLHDDQPENWRPGAPAVLLMHGLAGCHRSPYLVRIAHKLNAAGMRTFRMDLRGCGAGSELARLPYHAGRSGDALAALQQIAALCPESPLGVAGFSLSGNIILKLLGESAGLLPANLKRAIAVNPPVDLFRCISALSRPLNRMYDRYFVRLLCRQISSRPGPLPAGLAPSVLTNVRGLFEFDDRFTAPAAGYDGAMDYYARCSSAQYIPAIEVPTLILAAANDPLIPSESFESLTVPASVKLHLTRCGGHLGFIGRRGPDPDRRWMDWRVVDWMRPLSSNTNG